MPTFGIKLKKACILITLFIKQVALILILTLSIGVPLICVCVCIIFSVVYIWKNPKKNSVNNSYSNVTNRLPSNANTELNSARTDYRIFVSPSSNPSRSDIENINELNRRNNIQNDHQDNNQVPSYDTIVDQNEYSRYLAPLAFARPEDNPPAYRDILHKRACN